jgi:beta-lactamase class A
LKKVIGITFFLSAVFCAVSIYIFFTNLAQDAPVYVEQTEKPEIEAATTAPITTPLITDQPTATPEGTITPIPPEPAESAPIPTESEEPVQIVHETVNKIDILTDAFTLNKLTVNHEDFTISDDVSETIEALIANYGRRFAFYVVSLDKSISIGYNPDEVFHTASTIKAPFALFCFKQIAAGHHSLDETKVYESRFRRGGSGVLQHRTAGGVYTVEELLYFAMHYSDNVAYYMLLEHFGKDGYNSMLTELGCKNQFLVGGRNWSETTPRDALIVWNEKYEFSKQYAEGQIFMDLLINAGHNLLKDALPNYRSAHKSGWSDIGYHDTGIVFGEFPYFIAIMTNSPGSGSDQVFVRRMIQALDRVIKEYKLFLDFSLQNN